jgi:DNA polymerase-3 subunit gamma/tau
VRDALSLLDRGLLTLENNKELDLNLAQNIFGYFDKSQLIDLFRLILKGDESKVIEIYRKIYDQGIEPKIFINDFLELIYYFKNINSLTLESTNFSLNDEEFSKIENISNEISSEVLILFWQLTIRTLGELDIVSNQNLSVEMFLMRLMYLSSSKISDDKESKRELSEFNEMSNTASEFKKNTIDQIKNITQEKKIKPETQKEADAKTKISINSLDELIEICNENKEMKLKYELEKNINLVNFETNRIEISFNEKLEKNFVKDLSLKLFEWTDQRWIITFSKEKGQISIKDREQKKKNELINKAKDSLTYKSLLKKFPDANLIDIFPNKKDNKKN